jgi:acetylornithine/N-succinyldiaminopimelate aminotransferase
MGKIFFANSGAEANEGMIKLARKYSFDKYGEGRNKIITLKQSFHGRTVTTLKATGQDKFHQYFFPFTEGFDYAAANDIEDMKRKIDDTTCAVMMEMIQGEGGVLPLDKEFVQATAEICKEKDILLLIDEVQTGIGRTGSLFCYEQYGVQPNIISMAKGLGGGVPIGAVMADKKCQDVLGAGTHGTTFGGNPLCCAAANTVLDIVNKPEFLKSVQEKGEYLKKEILAIGSPKVKTVRGMGLMLGIVVDKDERAAMVSQLMEKGVLVLTAGTEAIRLLPPLVITKEEMDEAIVAMREVF